MSPRFRFITTIKLEMLTFLVPCSSGENFYPANLLSPLKLEWVVCFIIVQRSKVANNANLKQVSIGIYLFSLQTCEEAKNMNLSIV